MQLILKANHGRTSKDWTSISRNSAMNCRLSSNSGFCEQRMKTVRLCYNSHLNRMATMATKRTSTRNYCKWSKRRNLRRTMTIRNSCTTINWWPKGEIACINIAAQKRASAKSTWSTQSLRQHLSTHCKRGSYWKVTRPRVNQMRKMSIPRKLVKAKNPKMAMIKNSKLNSKRLKNRGWRA